MPTNPNPPLQTISDKHNRVLKTTSALVYLLILLGGLVCITDASAACPDWPGCYGKIIPPLETGAIIEWTHRVVALITGFFLIASLVMGWKRTPEIKPLKWLPVLALLLTGAVSAFGARAVLYGLSPVAASFDLAFALLVLAVMLITTVVAYTHREAPEKPIRFSLSQPISKLSLITTLLVFDVLVSAVLVAEVGSVVRCVGWPMYFGQLAPANLSTPSQISRLSIAAVASLLIFYLVYQVRKNQSKENPLRKIADTVGLFFLIEVIIGGIMIAIGYQTLLLVVYVAAAAALWGALVALTVLAGLTENR
jgi:cytochrome c oxidase assembly protein subunit 15